MPSFTAGGFGTALNAHGIDTNANENERERRKLLAAEPLLEDGYTKERDPEITRGIKDRAHGKGNAPVRDNGEEC